MPNVQAQPRRQSNNDIVTEFTDAVGTTLTTYTFPTLQNSMKIENKGAAALTFNVGSYTNISIQPGQVWENLVDYTTFTIRAASGSQRFDVRSIIRLAYDANNDGIIDLANKLATPRSITLNGVVMGSATFDGSQDITITTSGSPGGGGGDMFKATYDVDNDGVVDKAAKLQTPRSIILSGSVSGSATFDGSGDVTINTTGGGSGTSYEYNVKSYGAVGNGSANDTTAITSAISACSAAGGGVVKIPAGTYKITSSITIPSQVILVGHGRGITVIQLADGANSDMIILDGTTNNNGIRDLTIKGNAWGGAASSGKTGLIVGKAGLSGANNDGTVNNMYIHNVQIRDIGGDGFKCFPNTWTYFIDDLTVEFCHGYGMLVQSTDNTYSTLKLTANGKAGLYVTGHNNRFTDGKIIFNGRGQTVAGSTDGSTGTDAQNAGVYVTGRRNAFTAIECQENYGNGWTFDGATDILLATCLSDANGYSAIDPANTNTALKKPATAFGWYFTNNAARITGVIQSTVFKQAISQVKGYQIDAGCANITLLHENDHVQSDTNSSTATCVVISSKNFADVMQATNYTLGQQASQFIHSGNTMTNAIAAYNNTYFNLDTVSGYTIVGNEIQNATTAWAGLPRLGTRYFTVTTGRTYLVHLKVKPALNNYKIRLISLYDEAGFVKFNPDTDGVYSNSVYTDLWYTFTADRNSAKALIYLDDKNTAGGANSTQGALNLKEFSFIDITDMLALYYTAGALDTVVKNNYFLGSRTFT